MASIVLGTLGASLGPVGGAIGAAVGSLIDNAIVSALTPAQRVEGPRLDSLTVTASSEGGVVPRLIGTARLPGTVIWATDFLEDVNTETQGGKGSGPKIETTTYSYSVSFALALCEGPITDIGRVWIDGKPVDIDQYTYRLYLGDEEQTPDPLIAAAMGAEDTPAYRGTAYIVFEALPLADYGNRLPQFQVEVIRDVGTGLLGDAVADICDRAGMAADRIDASALDGTLDGMVLTAVEPPRSSIARLQTFWGFDGIETGGLLRFVYRGPDPVATMTEDDLVAAGDGAEEWTLARVQETELPQALKWTFIRSDEEFDQAVAEATRWNDRVRRVEAGSFGIMATPQVAEREVRRELVDRWVGRDRLVTTLPPSRLALDPGDAVTITLGGRMREARITRVALSDVIQIEATAQDRGARAVPDGAARPVNLRAPVVYGDTSAALMDLPAISESDVAQHPLFAAWADPWPGLVGLWRSATLDGFTSQAVAGTRARTGTLAADLPAGPAHRWDRASALVIDMDHGTLDGLPEADVLAGANMLAVESSAGQWEILQYVASELVIEGQYRLTHLLRGRRGTEDAIGDPAPTGARVVALDIAAVRVPVSLGEIGAVYNWRAGPGSLPYSDARFAALTFTPGGRGLLPFAPGPVAQVWRRPRGADIPLSWRRRSRDPAADSWVLADVPTGETIEAWEVDILDGDTVLRTLAAATTAATYTEAQQTADWGAPLARGDSLTIRIYQLSATLGRGLPKTITLEV